MTVVGITMVGITVVGITVIDITVVGISAVGITVVGITVVGITVVVVGITVVISLIIVDAGSSVLVNVALLGNVVGIFIVTSVGVAGRPGTAELVGSGSGIMAQWSNFGKNQIRHITYQC